MWNFQCAIDVVFALYHFLNIFFHVFAFLFINSPGAAFDREAIEAKRREKQHKEELIAKAQRKAERQKIREAREEAKLKRKRERKSELGGCLILINYSF